LNPHSTLNGKTRASFIKKCRGVGEDPARRRTTSNPNPDWVKGRTHRNPPIKGKKKAMAQGKNSGKRRPGSGVFIARRKPGTAKKWWSQDEELEHVALTGAQEKDQAMGRQSRGAWRKKRVSEGKPAEPQQFPANFWGGALAHNLLVRKREQGRVGRRADYN